MSKPQHVQLRALHSCLGSHPAQTAPGSASAPTPPCSRGARDEPCLQLLHANGRIRESWGIRGTVFRRAFGTPIGLMEEDHSATHGEEGFHRGLEELLAPSRGCSYRTRFSLLLRCSFGCREEERFAEQQNRSGSKRDPERPWLVPPTPRILPSHGQYLPPANAHSPYTLPGWYPLCKVATFSTNP